MPDLVITITATPISEMEYGKWCPECLLPSASSALIAFELGSGGYWLSTVTACNDCDWYEEVLQ